MDVGQSLNPAIDIGQVGFLLRAYVTPNGIKTSMLMYQDMSILSKPGNIMLCLASRHASTSLRHTPL